MTKIYCSKTFSKYFDLKVIIDENQNISIFDWSSHLIKMKNKTALIVVIHQTLFYFFK